jgi:hypothetical protein
MKKKIIALLAIVLHACTAFGQGVGIPSKNGGIGFGNLPKFTGVRFNVTDHDLERVDGINVTVWRPKDESSQAGVVSGLSIGLPLAMGAEDMRGIALGLAGVGAKRNLSGINVGGLGVGSGGNVTGINVAGFGVGSGGDMTGINVGGLGAGSGGNVTGFNFGGLGVGSGKNMSGINIGGLGAGSGADVAGISIGGLGVGAGENISGLSIAGVGLGSGGNISGVSIAGVGLGAGKSINGVAVAIIGIGAPTLRALTVSAAAGGKDIAGVFISPAYLQVGSKHDEEDDAVMNGASISACNNIKGTQKGVTIGIFNYATRQRGIQLGLLNYVKDNPKGLRLLPVFNTHFGSRKIEGN